MAAIYLGLVNGGGFFPTFEHVGQGVAANFFHGLFHHFCFLKRVLKLVLTLLKSLIRLSSLMPGSCLPRSRNGNG